MLHNEPFFVSFFDITKQFAVHIWTRIGRYSVYVMGEHNHGSLHVFAAFAAVCADKFAMFDVCCCRNQAVSARLDPA